MKIKIKTKKNAKKMLPIFNNKGKLYYNNVLVANILPQSEGGIIPDNLVDGIGDKVADVIKIALSDIKPEIVNG